MDDAAQGAVPTHTHARTREDRRVENQAAWRRDEMNANAKEPTPLDAPAPPMPEDVEECARQARAVAWRILHGAPKDSDRMNAARFFQEQAKAGGGLSPTDPVAEMRRAAEEGQGRG
jgi:hypothetical protein